MKEKENRPLPVDPVDGTRVYMPLGKRFSVGEELGDISFDPYAAEASRDDSRECKDLHNEDIRGIM